MARFVLTADRALFTDFNGLDALGFGMCVPCRLIPRFVEYHVLAPKTPTKNGRAVFAPYALAKVEAALLAAGFSRDEVYITPPEALGKVVGSDTEAVLVHVVDPQGLAPVSWTLKALLGGGVTCTQYEFERLMARLRRLKARYGFRIVVGGPGAWQLRGRMERFGIDVLLEGEAEEELPRLLRRIREVKPGTVIAAKPVPVEKIPTVVTPSRNSLVEITRGCPRRCHFCSPTMRFFRTIPLERILRELELNLSHGARRAEFVTEDVLLYGASAWPLRLNAEAVKRLYDEALRVTRRYGVERIPFSHATASSALAIPDAVKYISEANALDEDHPFLPQMGLESGSPRIVARFFAGKPWPWKPEDWPRIILDASQLLNEHYWYPCYTYIIGFPGATPDDYVATTELLDRLEEQGFRGWTFPLLLIPMGGTLIEKRAEFKTLQQLPREAIDCMVRGWELSIKFIEWVYPRLMNEIENPIARSLAMKMRGAVIKAMKQWMDLVRKGPEAIAEAASGVDIRSLRGIARTVLAIAAR